jgi:hypothetical protein
MPETGDTMTRVHKFITALRRDLSTDETHVHFHQGPQGSPAACHDVRCASPRLTIDD